MKARRARPHIGDKVRKRAAPAGADLNPATTIKVEVPDGGVLAPMDHGVPRGIFRLAAVAMLEVGVGGPLRLASVPPARLLPKTAAALSMPSLNARRATFDFIAAVAPKPPNGSSDVL